MLILSRLGGTLKNIFRIFSIGIKDVSGVATFRNASDTDYVGIRADSAQLETPLPVASGGTGRNSVTSNALLMGDGTNALDELTIGSEGEYLRIISGNLAWDIGGGGSSGDVDISDGVQAISSVVTLVLPNGTLSNPSSGIAEYNSHGYGTSTQFDATSISNLSIWLKSDGNVTFGTLNRISQWDDSSGNGNHAVQATAANQPKLIYSSYSINGYPIVYFNGVSNFMNTTLIPQTGAGARTVIIVGNSANNKFISGTRFVLGWGGAGASEFYGIALGATVSPVWRTVYQIGTILAELFETPSPEDSPFIIMSIYDGTTIRAYYNGVLVSELTIALNTGSTTNLTIGTIGTGYGGVSLAQIAVYSKALNSTEREQVFTELGIQYNIPVTI